MNDSQIITTPLPIQIQGNFCKDSVFKLGEELGSGAVSKVFKGQEWKENKIFRDVAIKIIEVKTNEGSFNIYFEKEKKVLENIRKAGEDGQASGIMEVYDLIEKDHRIFVITEICTGGDLYEKFLQNENFTGIADTSTYLHMLLDLARGINSLHQLGIVHRDIKPENVLVTSTKYRQNILKLADFGVSSCDNQESMKSQVGTVYYLAPEIIQGQPYSNKVDIWGFGCLSHELKVGNPLFDGANQIEIIKKIKNFNGNYQFIADEKQHGMSDGQSDVFKRISIDVIAKCLSVIPESRPTAGDIIKELEKIAEEFKISLKEKEEVKVDQVKSPNLMNAQQMNPSDSIEKQENNYIYDSDEQSNLINREENHKEVSKLFEDFLKKIIDSQERMNDKQEYSKLIEDPINTTAVLLNRSSFEKYKEKKSSDQDKIIYFMCQLVSFMKCEQFSDMQEFFRSFEQVSTANYPEKSKDYFMFASAIHSGVTIHSDTTKLNEHILQLLKFTPMKNAILRASKHEKLFIEIEKKQLDELTKQIAQALPNQSIWDKWYCLPFSLCFICIKKF